MDEDKKRSLDGMRQRCEIEFLGYVEQRYIMKYTGGQHAQYAHTMKFYNKYLKLFKKML